jgi:hypothetical protein
VLAAEASIQKELNCLPCADPLVLPAIMQPGQLPPLKSLRSDASPLRVAGTPLLILCGHGYVKT